MPRRQPTLDEIKALIPENLWPRTVVAGGFAYDPEHAHDVDIWVLRDMRWIHSSAAIQDMEADASAILNHMLLHPLPVLTEEPPSYTELDDTKIMLVKAGRFTHGSLATGIEVGMPFHILCANTHAIGELLGWFDLPIHAIGYHLTGQMIEAPYRHDPGQRELRPLQINSDLELIPDPLQTLTRLVRFTKRYSRPMNFEAAQSLLERAKYMALRAELMPETADPVPLAVEDIPF
jgi:hypothetical protein